jgi:hypothetical protein
MPSPRYTVRLPQALDALVQARVQAGTPFAVLIREALAAYLADTAPTGHVPTAADAADSVQALGEQLALLRTRVEALEQVLTRRRQDADTSADTPAATAPTRDADSAPTPADTRAIHSHQPRAGRPRSALGLRIVEVLAAHPDGLSAEQIRVYVSPERPIGDILSGMKRTGAVQTIGHGRRLRYVLTQGDESMPGG